jgi:hypothetical protein
VFPVPVAPKATAAPGIAFANVSRTVTVIRVVFAPLLAVIVGVDAVSVDLLPAGVVLGLMVNPLLVAPESEPDEATRVYPVPVLSMLRFANVAAPADGRTLVVPDSTPVPGGLVPIATAMAVAYDVAVLPYTSWALTCTAGVIGTPAWAAVGCCVNASFVAGPGVAVVVKVTGLPLKLPEVAVRVSGPAVVPSVQLPTVAMPVAFVCWDPPVTLPPPERTAKVIVVPGTGLLN